MPIYWFYCIEKPAGGYFINTIIDASFDGLSMLLLSMARRRNYRSDGAWEQREL